MAGARKHLAQPEADVGCAVQGERSGAQILAESVPWPPEFVLTISTFFAAAAATQRRATAAGARTARRTASGAAPKAAAKLSERGAAALRSAAGAAAHARARRGAAAAAAGAAQRAELSSAGILKPTEGKTRREGRALCRTTLIRTTF